MTRLFVKVYLGIALVLVVGTAATLFLLERRVEAVREEAIEDRLVETLLAIKHRAETDPFFLPDAFQQLGRSFRLRVEVVPLRDLPEAVRTRIVAGESFVVREARGPVGYTAYNEDSALVGLGRFRGGPQGLWDRRRPPWENDGGRMGRPDGFGPPRGAMRPDGRGAEGSLFRGGGPTFLLLLIAVLLLLVGPAIFLMIRPVERRIRNLSDVADRFGEGRLGSRAEVSHNDALTGLSRSFNEMAGRIEGLVTDQKELLRAVSHELRTPLARLFFILDDAESATNEADRRVQLGRIQSGLSEMNELVEELLSFVRLDAGRLEAALETVDVAAVLEDAAAVGRELRDGVAIDTEVSPVTVLAVPRYFRRAVVNLVTNATRHAASRVVIGSRESDAWIEVIVDDDGPGVPADSRDRIFEPFTRVDSSRNAAIGGAGLGLAIVSRIVKLHGGTSEVTESPLGGARFRLQFPRELSQSG